MKKNLQWIIIGGIGAVLLFLYLHKRQILLAKDLSGGGGGGGSSAVNEGTMLQRQAQMCLKSGKNLEECGNMVFPL